MINIAIDRGNSYIKLGVFKDNDLITFENIDYNFDIIKKLLDKFNPDNLIISSVVSDNYNLTDFLNKKVNKIIFLDHTTPLPVVNHYKTPETLGKDRLAAVVGAQFLFPEENILIIDAGTAITYDLLLNGIDYIGGDISPGINMRIKALNQFTSRLPLVNKSNDICFPGKNTIEAISSGTYNGMIFEIEGYRTVCNNKYGSVKTIITGGDALFFEKNLKKPIFADQNLVLKGLNRIMEYNV